MRKEFNAFFCRLDFYSVEYFLSILSKLMAFTMFITSPLKLTTLKFFGKNDTSHILLPSFPNYKIVLHRS